MRSYFLLNLTLLAGVTACDFKVNPGDTDTSEDTTGEASSSDGEGTTSGGSDGSGQSSNSGGSSVGTSTEGSGTDATTGMSTATATSTSTSGEMTSSSTSATSGSTTATTDGPPPDPIDPTPCEGEAQVIPGHAIAYLNSQVPPPPDTTGGSSGGSGTTGGDPIDPGTLHVRLSSQSLACEDPAAALQCGGNWAVSFALAPEFQAPGLYHLSGPQVFGVGTETGADEGGGECSWGGGSFFATLEVIAVDDEAVTGRLCHVEGPIPANAAELEGKFVAPRCP